MSIIQSINNAVRKKEEGGWKRWSQLFWAIDLHGTIIRATYNNDSKMDFYPNAQYVLKHLSHRNDMMLILWTGTYKNQKAGFNPMQDWYIIEGALVRLGLWHVK